MIHFVALTAWILTLLHAAQPVAPKAILETYPTQAAALARVLMTDELAFTGPTGLDETAAVLVETATEEGHLDLGIVGDHGASLCTMQIGASNLKKLGVTRAAILSDYETCFRAGLEMIRESLRVCRSHPTSEKLAQYMTSDGRCEDERALRRSRYRMSRARALLKSHPFEATPPS